MINKEQKKKQKVQISSRNIYAISQIIIDPLVRFDHHPIIFFLIDFNYNIAHNKGTNVTQDYHFG